MQLSAAQQVSRCRSAVLHPCSSKMYLSSFTTLQTLLRVRELVCPDIGQCSEMRSLQHPGIGTYPCVQDAIGAEYTAMMAQLNALFAQQKALLTSISQPLPPPPGVDGDTSVVRIVSQRGLAHHHLIDVAPLPTQSHSCTDLTPCSPEVAVCTEPLFVLSLCAITKFGTALCKWHPMPSACAMRQRCVVTVRSVTCWSAARQ